MASPGVSVDAAAARVLDAWLDRFTAALPVAGARARACVLAELRDGLYTAAERHLARTHGAAGAGGAAAWSADGVGDPGGSATWSADGMAGSAVRSADGAEGAHAAVLAARAAVAEFGDPGTVAASFAGEFAAGLARRVALSLVATGPVVGLAWLAALAPPPWPPRPVVLLAGLPPFLVALAVAVPAAVLAIAAAGPAARWFPVPAGSALAPAAAGTAATACVVGDLVLLAALALASGGVAGSPAPWLAATASATRLCLAGRAACRCAAARVALR